MPIPQAPAFPPELAFLAGGGEMGERIRAFDWSATPLGPATNWPQSLKTAVRIMLASRQPVWIGWGAELIYFYNDPYQDIIGGRHPVALGKPTKDVWPEIWDVIGPMLDTAMGGVEGTYVEEQLLVMERYGYPEETYYTFSYTPIPNDVGGAGGIICVNTDDTQRVIGERRIAALRALASGVADTNDAEEACQCAAKELEGCSYDVPFALIYLVESGGSEARLVASAGVKSGIDAAAESISLRGDEKTSALWPLRATLTGEKHRVTGLAVIADLPGGPWPERTHTALVLPLSSGTAGVPPFGFLVAGVSPRCALDDAYEGFFDLLAASVAQGVANARALEEERRRAEALAELDRAKTAFFSNVSHEFRTPLTLMLAPLEELLARRDVDLPSTAAASLEMVNRNGLRLLRLVNTLLDFSRIEAGRVQATFEPTNLAAFTGELASVFRSACERAGLRLTVACPQLPEPVFVDQDMWEKIVLNLLSNAFKFTFEGEIAVSLANTGTHAELRVRDSGVGIPAEEMPRLFERFHRIESTRGRTHEGSGIGLALVHELVRLHGGQVSAESTLGQGTTFIVRLPLGSSHLPAERLGLGRSTSSKGMLASPFLEEALRWLPDSPDELPEIPASPLLLGSEAHPADQHEAARFRVLVADDNADMRLYLTRLLAEHYTVETVPDGEAALAIVHQRRPDLILSDVMMPKLDGLELVRRLRADDALSTLPVILLSARAGEESRVEGLNVGADDYLVKPFSARELLARVESHLKLAQVRIQAEGRVKQILESITDGFHTLDSEGRFRQFNAAAQTMFAAQGVDTNALVGRHFFDALPEARGTRGADAIMRTWTEHVPTAVESFFPLWQRWYAVRNFPMADGGVATFFQDITENKQAEEVMRASHDTFRHLVENSPFGVYAVDADFRLVQVSVGAEKVFRNVSPLLGRDFAEVLRLVWEEPFASEAINIFHHTLETGEPYHSPSTVERRSDFPEIESYDWRIERIVMPDGRPGVVCHFYDLSEHQQYEAALKASEARFRLLAESLPQFVWECNEAGVIEFTNQRWSEFSGLTLEETRDLARLGAVFHPDDAPGFFSTWAEAQATVSPLHEQARMRRRDGEYRWFLIRAEPMVDGTRVVRWFGTSTDITEHKRAEEALAENHERLQASLDAAKAGTFRWNIQTNQLDWDKNLDALFGLRPGTTIRSLDNFIAAVHPEERSGVIERCKRCALEGEDFDMEFRVVWPDGSIHWLDDKGRIFSDPEGRPLYMTGACVEITARKNAEEALRRAAAEAEAASRAKDSFLAALSHELRTPLTPVLMSAASLREDERLPADAREQLSMMERNIALEARLIDDLLDITRIAKGKLALRLQPCDTHSLISLAIEIVRDEAQAKGLVLESSLRAEKHGLVADPTRFQQVIWNLLRNAVRFTPRGGRISIHTWDIDNNGTPSLGIEVSDTGIGIEADALGRIFAPFEQAPSGGGHLFGGLGLGLAIARAIVELHGGTIRAESPGRGAGAVFTVVLPGAIEPPKGRTPVANESDHGSSALGAGPSLRLLLVEDHEPTLRVLSRLLEREGHQLTTVNTVTDALAAASSVGFDFVISDVGLPDGTGVELMSALRERHGLTGIALSGYGMEEDVARTRAAGFVAHLIKPVDFHQLRRALQDVQIRRL
ncbi:ATP-binding protein [Verrucomicrobiota bacterium sgz303538]